MCDIKKCIKLIVLAFNVLLGLVGVALITVGAVHLAKFNEAIDAIPDSYTTLRYIPILTIVLGSVIFLISFFGCCGAIQDNSCVLTSYAVILLIIFILQIALGVGAFLTIKNEKDVYTSVNKTIDKTFKESDKTSIETIDFIQSHLHCCGTTGPVFWAEIGRNIPKSCYKNKDDTQKVYEAGCQESFFNFLVNAVKLIGIVVLALTATEVLGAVFSLWLANSQDQNEQ